MDLEKNNLFFFIEKKVVIIENHLFFLLDHKNTISENIKHHENQ